jgi:hypothetical protein
MARALYLRTVYASGRNMILGARGLTEDYYLYQVELRALAAALERKDLTTLDQYVLLFDQLKFMKAAFGDSPPTATQWRDLLVSMTKAAVKQPTHPEAVVFLLMRDLGLRHGQPYDLATPVAPDKILLDPVQTLLLTSDLLLRFDAMAHKGKTAAIHRATARDIDCEGNANNNITATSPFAYGVLGALAAANFKGLFGAAVSKVSLGLLLLSVDIDAIHGPIMVASLDFRSLAPIGHPLTTHFGPAGHAPQAGQPIDFKFALDNLFDFGKTVITCGPIARVAFPKKGGVPSVPVNFINLDYLSHFGTLTLIDGGKTDANGIATLHFTPNNETPFVGFGLSTIRQNYIVAYPLWGSATNNNWIGYWHQYFLAKDVDAHYEISDHEAPGFQFSGIKWKWDFEDTNPNDCLGHSLCPWSGSREYEITNATVCGSVYKIGWQHVQTTYSYDWIDYDPTIPDTPITHYQATNLSYDAAGVWQSGSDGTFWQAGPAEDPQIAVPTITIDPGKPPTGTNPGTPPTAKLTLSFNESAGFPTSFAEYLTLTPEVASVPVTPDYSCPFLQWPPGVKPPTNPTRATKTSGARS